MINKVILIGNCGNDPQIADANGIKVANIGIATTEKWRDAQNQPQERTDWHTVVMFRNLAELAEKYVKKGAQIYIEGKLRTRSYEKDGTKHYRTEVYAETFRILGHKPQNTQNATSQQAEYADIAPSDPSKGDLPF